MSRFVAAGENQDSADSDPTENNDAWAKARQLIDNARNSKRLEPGKQDDGKSLYEVLQANKAAKQEAFEEASKLRNQFRSLDDSEIEFLDSVRDAERRKAAVVEQENAEQLDVFREQRRLAEQDALKKAQQATSATVTENDPRDGWTATRKRRRAGDINDALPVSKQRRESTSDEKAISSPSIIAKPPQQTSQTNVASSAPTTAQAKKSPSEISDTTKLLSAGLGLTAYDSDSNSD